MREGPRIWVVGTFQSQSQCREFCDERRIPIHWQSGECLLVKLMSARQRGIVLSLLCASENGVCEIAVRFGKRGQWEELDRVEARSVLKASRGATPLRHHVRMLTAALVILNPCVDRERRLSDVIRALVPVAIPMVTIAQSVRPRKAVPRGFFSGKLPSKTLELLRTSPLPDNQTLH